VSRIVYLGLPAQGHVNPTLPVVQELTRRGEQIAYYNTEQFRSEIERAGAAFQAYPPSLLTTTSISTLVEHGNLVNVTCLILRATEQLLPWLLGEIARERPDLIVFDSIALWGKMAATELRVPAAASISHFVMDEGHMQPGDLLRMLPQVVPNIPTLLLARRRLRKRYRTAFPPSSPLFPVRDRLNLVYTARELQPDTPIIDDTFRFVGPSIDPVMRAGEFPFEQLDRARLVYVSFGTLHHMQQEFLDECFAAFAGHPAQFVVAAGRTPSGSAVPANFMVYRSVPQLEILQRAEAFITHGGLNSVHESLYYGVPLVIIPHQFEQLLNARAVAARGAGVILPERLAGKPIAAATLRRALDLVSSNSKYRESARSLQDALRATGGYRQAADEIQGHISSQRAK
jgi:MGT family glycosyltransferase